MGTFISSLNSNIYVCGKKQNEPLITAGNINTLKYNTLSKLYMHEKFSDS
jgi:hypothetical protein